MFPCEFGKFTVKVKIYLVAISGAGSVTMHKVAVPAQVMNGTLPYVILDCDYTLDVSEKRSGGSMVLKWYRNGRNIYQWIPPAHPRVCTKYSEP